ADKMKIVVPEAAPDRVRGRLRGYPESMNTALRGTAVILILLNRTLRCQRSEPRRTAALLRMTCAWVPGSRRWRAPERRSVIALAFAHFAAKDPIHEPDIGQDQRQQRHGPEQ